MIAPGNCTVRRLPWSVIVTGWVVSSTARLPAVRVRSSSVSTGLSCAITPRNVPPETKPGAPALVVDTTITCEPINGATPTTPGSAAMRV